MPILLKRIDGSIISLFNSDNVDYLTVIPLKKGIVGGIGFEDYINLSGFEGFTQTFSNTNIIEEFFVTEIGPNSCYNYTDLNISL